jgi:RNA polymerase sigma-70 factor (ECF subfamily)
MTATPPTRPDFTTLAREFSPMLLRYLGRQVGDTALAEDLLQETLLRAARSLDGFAGRASPKTWLFAIASRVVIDHFRQPARRQKIIDIDDTAELEDGALALDERLVIDEMNQCVREVIDSLPPDYRAALVLHDLEGMDGAQTAEVLGLSVGAVRVRLHRARQRLATALQNACGFYRDSDSVLRCTRR